MAVTAAPPLTCKRNNTKQPATTAHVEIGRCSSSDGERWNFDQKERQMRIRLIGGSVAIALVALLSSAAPSQAYIPHPWCSAGTGNESGAPVCAYSSYDQCMENKTRGGCVANPWIEPLPTVPGSTVFLLAHHHHHHSLGHGRV